MEIFITLKDPDGVYESLQGAAVESVPEGITDKDEREMLTEARKEKLGELCKKWVEYGEYVTIAIDTEKLTARVVENK